MTDIQAALGISQLKKLDEFVKKRHELVRSYNNQLQKLPLILPYQSSEPYLYPVRLTLNEITETRKEVFEELGSSGIGINIHYIPVHTQLYYSELGFIEGMYTEAEKYYSEVITLPLFSNLVIKEIEQVSLLIESLYK